MEQIQLTGTPGGSGGGGGRSLVRRSGGTANSTTQPGNIRNIWIW
jgi:hypothetical protein